MGVDVASLTIEIFFASQTSLATVQSDYMTLSTT